MDKRVYWHHRYKTRDGHTVFIIATNQQGVYPVVGEMTVDGSNEPYVWTRTGCFVEDQRNHPYDLTEDVTK
jgi:hypothetical protein